MGKRVSCCSYGGSPYSSFVCAVTCLLLALCLWFLFLVLPACFRAATWLLLGPMDLQLGKGDAPSRSYRLLSLLPATGGPPPSSPTLWTANPAAKRNESPPRYTSPAPLTP